MNRDQIKYVAMFTMLLNHIANIFLEPGTFLFEVMVDVGYFTAITMCYFLVEGYGYTRSKEKYGKRLLLFALISEIPFCLAFTEEGTISFVSMNMLFTLFLCFLILYAMEKIPSGTRRILCILGLVFASAYSDWALLAPIFTYWFASCGLRDAQGKMLPAGSRNADPESHLAGSKNADLKSHPADSQDPDRKNFLWKVFGKAMLFFGLLNLVENMGQTTPVRAVVQSLGATAGILLSALCIIYLYNGKRSEKHRTFSKWFFYIFYPAHLLILGILRIAI
ncbi:MULTISPECIES: TraX family protein [unclassified Ruminococcus]|uniref:TraX family protein n=1 Tax=unclassified Ruminococcus TaxID=2608920 RepID=UPI00319DC409